LSKVPDGMWPSLAGRIMCCLVRSVLTIYSKSVSCT